MQRSPRDRRPRGARPLAEGLESRLALTGGAGDIFAVIPAQVATAGGSAAVPITLDPAHFTTPHNRITLAIDVSGIGTTPPTPAVLSVVDAKGHKVPITHATYGAALSKKLGGKTQASAVLVTLPTAALKHGKSVSYTVNVGATGGTKGGIDVGFFLAGDSNGDGVVDQTDLKAIKSEAGTQYGDAKYAVSSDVNRDGLINPTDLRVAKSNLGAKVTINPTLTGHPNPTTAVDSTTLTTGVQALGFTGTTTPGAKVTIIPINGQSSTITTTAGADGTFNATLNLSPGLNSFQISETDAFGQANSGVLPGITYVPKKS